MNSVAAVNIFGFLLQASGAIRLDAGQKP